MRAKTDSTPASEEQLALYTERAAGERVIHGLLRGTEAYDAWHLALYFKAMFLNMPRLVPISTEREGEVLYEQAGA